MLWYHIHLRVVYTKRASTNSGCRVLIPYFFFPKYRFSFSHHTTRYTRNSTIISTRALLLFIREQPSQTGTGDVKFCMIRLHLLTFFVVSFYFFLRFLRFLFLPVNVPIKPISCNKIKEKYTFSFRSVFRDERAAVYVHTQQ
jgi:hypothetical protein|uniref:Uncharacterized protein n=1 Tax=Sipha flava TaxID=143950 RepID=A0A2S2Q7S6_9HEMI